MPLYEYRCTDCGEEFEALVPAGRADAEPCPDCGSEARRLHPLPPLPEPHPGRLRPGGSARRPDVRR
ncbi:MAG TPA: zinc ribbon domain-containing protein [Actinomycetes bacterium]|nr:zinc ribbon domain-containing protein [Actinomycetes bacterium]